MLIRRTTRSDDECITQRHHAVISGRLASDWAPSRLNPLLVQVIGLHDDPWRPVDARPSLDDSSGGPYDFVDYPIDQKIEFYRRGIDELERVHPYAAFMVSHHYTSFSGTRDLDALQRPEADRRERLAPSIRDPLLNNAETSLAWIQFFDVFSLHLCLTGPAADPDEIPRWLSDSSAWSTAPDGTRLELQWRDDAHLTVEPWPFRGDSVEMAVEYRPVDERFEREPALRAWWERVEQRRRTVACVPPD